MRIERREPPDSCSQSLPKKQPPTRERSSGILSCCLLCSTFYVELYQKHKKQQRVYDIYMPFDIGMGILVPLALHHFFGFPLTQEYILGGIIFSLLMDLDFLVAIFKDITKKTRGNSSHVHSHRDLFHYPLIYLPLGTFIASLFGSEWATLFFITSLIHFVHDSIGLGWGVQWLYPFSSTYYGFIYRYQPKGKKPFPLWQLYTIKKSEMKSAIEKWDDPHWIRNIYFKCHPYAIMEYVVFAIAILLLIIK